MNVQHPLLLPKHGHGTGSLVAVGQRYGGDAYGQGGDIGVQPDADKKLHGGNPERNACLLQIGNGLERQFKISSK